MYTRFQVNLPLMVIVTKSMRVAIRSPLSLPIDHKQTVHNIPTHIQMERDKSQLVIVNRLYMCKWLAKKISNYKLVALYNAKIQVQYFMRISHSKNTPECPIDIY